MSTEENPTPLKRVQLIPLHVQFAGRNSKCTEERRKEIEGYLAEGLPIAHTCALVGITEDTYYRWQKWGEKYLDGTGPEEHEIYGRLSEGCKAAIAQWQLGKIRTSLNTEKYAPNWVRDMTILERRDRAHWGRQDTIRVGVAPTQDERFL